VQQAGRCAFPFTRDEREQGIACLGRREPMQVELATVG
jgi:hypothetical protein